MGSRLPRKRVLIVVCGAVLFLAALAAVLCMIFIPRGKPTDPEELHPPDFVYIPEGDVKPDGAGVHEGGSSMQPQAPSSTPPQGGQSTPSPKPTTGIPFYDAGREQYSILDVWAPENPPTDPPDYTVPEVAETTAEDEEPAPSVNYTGSPYASVSPEGYMFKWGSEAHLSGQIRGYVLNSVYAPLEALPECIGTDKESAAVELVITGLAGAGGIAPMTDLVFKDSGRQSVWNELAPLLEEVYGKVYAARVSEDWGSVIDSASFDKVLALKSKFLESWQVG